MQIWRKLCFSVILTLLVALNILSQTSKQEKTQNKTAGIVNYDKDEYEIYSEVIRQQVRDIKGNTLVLALELSECSVGMWKESLVDAGIPSKNLNEIENYCLANKDMKAVLISRGLKLKSKLVLLEFAEIGKFFFRVNCEDGWKKFYKRYPKSNGNMGLSKVGFDKERTHAVVHYGNQRQCLDGEGYLFVLEKSQIGWEVVYKQSTWVS